MKNLSKLSKFAVGLFTAALLVPIISGVTARAEDDIAINSGNFPDATFMSVVSDFDTDNNGSLSKAEREAVINIHCENLGITTIKGIEHFPNLQGLWCLNNNISDWDLSQNEELVGIWCSKNDFESLDFTGLDNLEWVYCYECKLKSINVSQNKKLAYLECNSNPDLTTLDFSANTELENLFCSKCGLTKLDLTANTKLCELDAFKNKLTELYLPDSPYLKRLDIWDNENLGDVDVSKLTGLEFYNCANNGVTRLDMSNNPQLQLLICGYNEELTSLNVSNNPRLADLRLECDYNLPKLDISHNPQLYNLYAFGVGALPSVDISNNPYLIKTYNEGRYKNEPQLGYVHSYTIEFGGSEEYFEDITHCLAVDNGKQIITSGGNPAVVPECYINTNDGHSDSEAFATRGQAIQLLWEKAGKPSVGGASRFNDVAGSPYAAAIKWGESYNICFGYPYICSDSFCPDEIINREDFALMAHRFSVYMHLGSSFDYGQTDWYSDFYDIDYYGWGAFTWAVQFEVLNVYGDYCYPHGRVTVDELSAGAAKVFNLNEAASYSERVNANGVSDANWDIVPYYSATVDPITTSSANASSQTTTPAAGTSKSTGSAASKGSGSSKGSTNSNSKPSNEWKNGKWYNKDGSQTYGPTLKWKANSQGWWVEDSSGWYPVSQWQKIDGKWYYFLSNGYMDYSEYRDGCWLGPDGAWNENYSGGTWKSNSKGWWYEDAASWYPSSQWLWIDGKCYYFGADGYMYTSRYVDGYWVGSDGAYSK